MNEQNPWVFWFWVGIATFGGAVSSLSFQPYKTMGRWQIALAFIVSFTFSIAFGPMVAELISGWFFGKGSVNLRVYGAVMWFMAAASHYLIPVLIRRARDAAANAKPGGEMQPEEKP